MSPDRRPVLVAGALLAGAMAFTLSACSGSPPPAPASPPASVPAPSAAASTVAPEPTNTLPPPPEPTAPDPSRAGALDADSIPIPKGWRPVAREGGDEDGYLGNGTWVHARDPRYAAQDAIALGCAPISRDDYTDPIAALEGTLDQRGRPGIGLALQFATVADASHYADTYAGQVRSCTNPDSPVQVTVLATPGGLVNRRSYPDSEWLEVVGQRDDQLVMIILSDPGHKITDDAALAILDQIE